MSGELVRVERTAPILRVVLNRPAKRNALNAEMIEGVRKAFESAATDSEVRVVLVSAAGSDFCAGFDLTAVKSGEEPKARAERERAMLFDFSLGIRDHPTPTIAVVQGANVAAGMLISQACDLVVAADDSYFYNPLPLMGGVGLEVLWEPYDAGFRMAKRLLFTAERIPAERALELGMVTDVVPSDRLQPFADELAARVASMPPETLRLLKRSINSAQDLAGLREAQERHFELHQLGHQTSESRRLLHENREGRDLRTFFNDRDSGRSIT